MSSFLPELLYNVEDGHLLLDGDPRLVPQLGVHVRLSNHVEALRERLLRCPVLLRPQQGVALALVNLKSRRTFSSAFLGQIKSYRVTLCLFIVEI